MDLFIILLLLGEAFNVSKGAKAAAQAWQEVMKQNKEDGEELIKLDDNIITLVSDHIIAFLYGN
jgi:hypothetical protein